MCWLYEREALNAMNGLHSVLCFGTSHIMDPHIIQQVETKETHCKFDCAESHHYFKTGNAIHTT